MYLLLKYDQDFLDIQYCSCSYNTNRNVFNYILHWLQIRCHLFKSDGKLNRELLTTSTNPCQQHLTACSLYKHMKHESCLACQTTYGWGLRQEVRSAGWESQERSGVPTTDLQKSRLFVNLLYLKIYFLPCCVPNFWLKHKKTIIIYLFLVRLHIDQ